MVPWPAVRHQRGKRVTENELDEAKTFSVLSWLQTLCMFAAVVWLIVAGLDGSNDDQFVAEETSIR
jgi:hypothetical protein